MRIAILEPYIGGIGGAQKVIARYSNFLKSRGHHVEIFTQRYKRPAYSAFSNVKINLIGFSSKIFSPVVFMRKFKGFDVIIANDWPTHFASLMNNNVAWVSYTPKREFYDLKGYFWDNSTLAEKTGLVLKSALFKCIDKIAAKKVKKIFSISKTVQKRVKLYYNKDSEVFHPGVTYKQFSSGKSGDYFLCASRFVRPKRIDLIIASMKFLKNKKIKLIIAGDGPEGGMLAELCKHNKQIKLLTNVGEKELLSLYSKCLGVIYVPVNEDWGLVPIEAGASGKPVIGVNEGGLKETILDKQTGFLLNQVTPAEIAKKMDFLAANKNIAKKMGEKGRRYVKKFDWGNILPKFERSIKKV